MKARLIALYLPQYHPIPENDKWWGEGFTEWTNVKKAKPLFQDHHQPSIPGSLGYYNLLDAEAREKQAKLAKEHGIEGFCYWHYWFGNGKRLLEQPFNEVLDSKEPDFPFCLAWANESWSGIWHGSPDKILIEQEYPGREDDKAHFYEVLPAFKDKRYLTVDGKPIFLVYKPGQLPHPNQFTKYWRELAKKEGLKGIYFIGTNVNESWVPQSCGFDASTPNPILFRYKIPESNQKEFEFEFSKETKKDKNDLPQIVSYEESIKYAIPKSKIKHDWYPGIISNWDNTPRSGLNGLILWNSSPELFRKHLRDALDFVRKRKKDKRIIFIKSWNEWAEGNYLEPDERYGSKYLEVVREELNKKGFWAKLKDFLISYNN